VIVEDVAGNYYEVDTELGSFIAKLLEGRKSRLSDPIAGVVVKPGDAYTEVKIGGMEEPNHNAICRDKRCVSFTR